MDFSTRTSRKIFLFFLTGVNFFFSEKIVFTHYFDINEADFNKYIRNLGVNN